MIDLVQKSAARRHKLRHGLCLAALLTVALPGHALAQAYPRIAPHVPAAGPTPALAVPRPAPPLPASTTPILPALRGVVFLAQDSALQPNGLAPAAAGPTGISASGLPLLQQSGFAAQIAPLLNQPISFASLAALQRQAQLWYISHGHPFVDVTLPPQNIDRGVVQIVVTEYRVGQVLVTGNHWFSTPLIRRESGLVPGAPLTLNGLRDDLTYLNQNPFRQVTVVFEPGETTGATDVDLRTQDRPPLHLYATYDNQGVPSLGRDEWGAGGSWGNAFGLDQIISYQFTRSTLDRYNAHSVNWTIPLPWRDRLLVFGAYALERPDIGIFFDETGHSGQASIRYVHNLPDLNVSTAIRVTSDVQLGYDYKTTDNNLEFGGLKVFTSEATIDQFPLIFDISETDPLGQTQITSTLTGSSGGLTGNNNTVAFSRLDPGATSDYFYENLALTRATFLPAGFTLASRVLAQRSDSDLLFSEQVGLGGQSSIRGYITDTALGSNGVLLSQEIRAPSFSLGDIVHLKLPVGDAEQIGAFWDYGHVDQVTAEPHALNHDDLASAGLDLHAGFGRFVSVSFDIGWQLRQPPGAVKRGGFTDLSVLVGY